MATTADRVLETTSSTGTGAVTLAGAAAGGYQSFSSAFSVGASVWYAIDDSANNAWEVGIGHLTSATVFARDVVLSSSAAGGFVAFGAGSKRVFATVPANTLNGASTDSLKYWIVLCTGQSNMSGRGGPRDSRLDPLHDRLYVFNAAGTYASQISQAVDPLGSSDVAGGATVSMSPATTFGRALADSLPAGNRVLLLPCGYGGLEILSWQSGYQMDIECKRVLNAAIAAVNAEGATWDLAAILWHQGESDSDDTRGPAYAAALAALVNRMRTTYPGASAKTPFVCGGLMPEFIAAPPIGTVAGATAVQAALAALPSNVAFTGYAATPSGYPQDGYHISGPGQRILGRRMFDAWVRAKTNNLTPLAPGQVTGLTVTPTATAVALSWSAPSTGGTPTDYLVEYKLTSAGTWTTFADGASTATSATVTGLASTTSYDFRVTATNSVGSGVASSTATTSTTAAPTVPGQVSGLVLTPSVNSVSLSWTAPSNGGSAITDYVVEYKLTSAGTWTTFADGTSTAASATVTGLTSSTSYDFRVSAVNAVGTGTASSTSSTSTTASPTAPAQVTGLTATPATTSMALSWTAPSNGGSAITDYVVEYKLTSAGTWTTFADGTSTATSTTVTGLSSNTSYDFRVSAVNAVGTGIASSTSTASTNVATGGFADTFNRTATTSGLGTTDTGAKAWTENGVFGINASGQAYRVSAATDNYRSHAAALHGLSGGGTITLSITGAANYSTGAVLRQDANNIVIITDEGEIYRWIAGAWGGTSWGTYTARTAAPSTASPETLVVTWSASSITVTRNGTLISTITDSAIVAAAMASVSAGIWSNNNTNTFDSISVTA